MRTINKIFWQTALSLAFVACQNEDIISEEILQGADVYTLQGIMNGGNEQSRAQVQLNSPDEGSEFFIWNSEDRFTVYDIDAETLTSNSFTIAEGYSDDNPKGEAIFSTETPMTAGHKIVAVYPAQESSSENLTLTLSQGTVDGNYYNWNQNQESSWRDYMRQNMFMYAASTEVSSSTALSFGHLCALARITYINGTTESQSLSQCVLVGDGNYFSSSATLDISDGKVTYATGQATTQIGFTNFTVDAGRSQDIYILFFPGANFNTNGTLKVEINNGSTEALSSDAMNISEISSNNNNVNGFEAGKRYWFQVMQTSKGLIWKSNIKKEGVISNPALGNAIGNREGIQKDDNGFIIIEESKDALADITEIGGNFDTLEGIEYLPNLEKLFCWSGNLSQIDLSKNTKLKELQCNNTLLTSLDVSNNPELTYLECSSNQLTSLDLSKNSELTSLYCNNNQLTSLDLSKNSKLTSLNCDNNQLVSLDVSKNPKLTSLSCNENQLVSLDISNNLSLNMLHCAYNQLNSLDISQHTGLINLSCNENRLTTLDVSQNTKLTSLACEWNNISFLDVSKLTALTYLRCSGTGITSLDISENVALKILYCNNLKLTSLDISKNTELTTLNCYNSHLKVLDITHNTQLEELYCGDQVDEDYNSITLTLILTSAQQIKWESEWVTSWGNERVTPVVSE